MPERMNFHIHCTFRFSLRYFFKKIIEQSLCHKPSLDGVLFGWVLKKRCYFKWLICLGLKGSLAGKKGQSAAFFPAGEKCPKTVNTIQYKFHSEKWLFCGTGLVSGVIFKF